MRLVAEGQLSALLLCTVEPVVSLATAQFIPEKTGSLCSALLLLLHLLLNARISSTEAPVRAVTPELLAQAEKPRLSQQGTGN